MTKITFANGNHVFTSESGIKEIKWQNTAFNYLIKLEGDVEFGEEKEAQALKRRWERSKGILPAAKKTAAKAVKAVAPEESQAEVKVTSNGEPLQEVKGTGNIEAVSQSRVFTTGEGDTITVIA